MPTKRSKKSIPAQIAATPTIENYIALLLQEIPKSLVASNPPESKSEQILLFTQKLYDDPHLLNIYQKVVQYHMLLDY